MISYDIFKIIKYYYGKWQTHKILNKIIIIILYKFYLYLEEYNLYIFENSTEKQESKL